MRVLITGGKGQLGKDLARVLTEKGNYQITSVDREEMDISDARQTWKVILDNKPQVIIHAGANTNVDGCELDPDNAYLVNGLGTRNVAVAAQEIGAKLVYFSTDYVFDGKGSKPYEELELVNPQSGYGRSKLAGEEFVKAFSNRFFIVRTAWVFGKFGNNFVKTILRLAGEKDELAIVHDQVGSPTYTYDLAQFTEELINTSLYGYYHATNNGVCSWFEFTKAILEEAGIQGVKVKPITSQDLSRPAPRPAYSVLSDRSIRLNGLKPFRPWREALRAYLEDVKGDG
ncbi:MAG: dTDP-4-dehydrorhamnose reductase [Thermincolia bacterium]